MNKIRTILLASVAIFFFTACNDDTNIYQTIQTEPNIDNSKLADDENQYGYFGKYVEFGDGVVLTSRTWRIVNTSNGDEQQIDFYDDGSAEYSEQNETGNFDYGVSQDGALIKTSDGDEIEYIKSFTKFIGQDANGNIIEIPCYLLNYEQRFANDKVEACGSCITDNNGNTTCDL